MGLDDQGGPPNLGQAIIAIDPARLSNGAFLERMSVLLSAMDAQEGVSPPGPSRFTHRARAAEGGVTISATLHADLRAMAAGG